MHKIMQRGDEHMTEGSEIGKVLPVSQHSPILELPTNCEIAVLFYGRGFCQKVSNILH